ncbi:MAG: tRNA (N6-threonylcarbamoyladenosine(37)-N6)-methyltransferase TrmO [Deltaproteobacteria bacterium]|nr:tRNA (N6-threonylcarbamoyladenosine(37)-N6)-methyltransferase TrmO [Deltaproteobacteria bacterium]
MDNFKYEEMILRPVGFVRSEIKAPSLKAKGKDIEIAKGLKMAASRAKNIRSLVSELVISPELEGILDGLEDFSHILVIYWPHLLPASGRLLTRVHPMGQKAFPLVGIFSTCSPARPNPVLVTAVRLLEIKENILKVQGLEAIDGSPIIDIKPYTTSYYSAENIKVSDWMEQIQEAITRA